MSNQTFFVAIFAAFISTTTIGQNLVKNPSFENGSVNCMPDGPGGQRTGESFYNCLNDWKGVGMFKGERWPSSHSPDWYQSLGSSFVAQEGNHFVGMVNYEAIQQEMKNSLVHNSFYFISVWIKLNPGPGTDFSSAALNIYVDTKELEYKDDDPNRKDGAFACSPDYRSLKTNDTWLVKQIDISSYPLDEWVQIHFIYEYKGLKNRDVIAFELIDSQADSKVVGCGRSRIFIDNIEVMDPCAHPCAPNLPPLSYTPTISENGIDIVELNRDLIKIDRQSKQLCAIIDNANKIEFKIYNRWGGETYTRNWFDPNGLKNDSGPDPKRRMFAIAWDGENNDGDIVQYGVYTYTLWIGQCTGAIASFVGTIIFDDVYSYGGLSPYPIPWTATPLNIDCCEPGSITIDDVLTENYKVHYSDNITLTDNSEVSGAGYVLLLAGNSIDLLPNTQINTTGIFKAEIEQCNELATKRDMGFDQTIANDISKSTEVIIFPNPAKSFCRVQGDSAILLRSSLYNSQGVKLDEIVGKNEVHIFDINQYPKGFYLVITKTMDGNQHVLKLIIE